MTYHAFIDPDGNTYGSFEVVYLDDIDGWKKGFYWHPCFPGCIPDGESMGPFETEDDAVEDAQLS